MTIKILIIKDQHDRMLTTYVDRALEIMDKVIDSITEIIAIEDYIHPELNPINSIKQFIESKENNKKIDIVINTSFNSEIIELVNSINSYKVHLLYYKTPGMDNNVVSYLKYNVDKVYTLSRIFTQYFDEIGIEWELIDFLITEKEEYLSYADSSKILDYRYRDRYRVVNSLTEVTLSATNYEHIAVRKRKDKTDIVFDEYNKLLKLDYELNHSVDDNKLEKLTPTINMNDYQDKFENTYGLESKPLYTYVLDQYNIDIIIENLHRNKLVIVRETEMVKDLMVKYEILKNRIKAYNGIDEIVFIEMNAKKKIEIQNNIGGTIICNWAYEVMKESYKEQSITKPSSHRSIIFDKFNKSKNALLKISQSDDLMVVKHYFGKLDIKDKLIAFVGIGNPKNIEQLIENNTIDVYDISNDSLNRARSTYEDLEKTSIYDVLNPYKVDNEFDLVIINNILNYQETDFYTVINNIMRNFNAKEFKFIINTASISANFKYEYIDIKLLFGEFKKPRIENIDSMFIITVENDRVDTL